MFYYKVVSTLDPDIGDFLLPVIGVLITPVNEPASLNFLQESAIIPLAGKLAGLGVLGFNKHTLLEVFCCFMIPSKVGDIHLHYARVQDDTRVVLELYALVPPGFEDERRGTDDSALLFRHDVCDAC